MQPLWTNYWCSGWYLRHQWRPLYQQPQVVGLCTTRRLGCMRGLYQMFPGSTVLWPPYLMDAQHTPPLRWLSALYAPLRPQTRCQYPLGVATALLWFAKSRLVAGQSLVCTEAFITSQFVTATLHLLECGPLHDCSLLFVCRHRWRPLLAHSSQFQL